MFNSSFWPSSKKLSVAKNFLFNFKKIFYYKLKLLKEIILIFIQKDFFQYLSEEEILFLPFCYFEIKSFKKVKENNL